MSVNAGECRSVAAGNRAPYRCWILLKDERRGMGTKMTIAFFPFPTSIFKSVPVTCTSVYLFGGVKLQRSQILLQIWDTGFEIIKSLCDRELCLVWCADLGNLDGCRHLGYVRNNSSTKMGGGCTVLTMDGSMKNFGR